MAATRSKNIPKKWAIRSKFNQTTRLPDGQIRKFAASEKEFRKKVPISSIPSKSRIPSKKIQTKSRAVLESTKPISKLIPNAMIVPYVIERLQKIIWLKERGIKAKVAQERLNRLEHSLAQKRLNRLDDSLAANSPQNKSKTLMETRIMETHLVSNVRMNKTSQLRAAMNQKKVDGPDGFKAKMFSRSCNVLNLK